MATIQITRQPNPLGNFDVWSPAYSRLLCVAERSGASSFEPGYKFRVRILINEVQVAEIQQPANPDGKLYFDVSPYLKAYVKENAMSGPTVTGNLFRDRLESWAVKYQLAIAGIIGNTVPDPEVLGQVEMAFNGSLSVSDPWENDADLLGWFRNEELIPNCVDCYNWAINSGLLTFQPNWITKTMDPTMWFQTANDNFEVPQVDIPRRPSAVVPMYVQQWSTTGSFNVGGRVEPYLSYGIFSFQTRYYNGNTLIATVWNANRNTNGATNGWGPQTNCGLYTSFVNDTQCTIDPGYAALSMGYSYSASANELNATHAWITAHSFADPQICNRPWSGNPLNCNSQSSIAEYSGLVPIAAYRVNYVEDCNPIASDLPINREKPGQLIFLNSLGGWDVINLKNVKVTYNIKKSMWRNEDSASTITGWGAVRNHVYETDSTVTFSCATEYMNDYSENFIRQAFASPVAYLRTQMPADNVSPGISGDDLNNYNIKGVITTQAVTPKRRATDKLYQYNFEFLADAKFKTQRS